MKITLDENYYARTDFTALGYVGETNARIITIENYQCEGADSYKMRFKYPDSVVYDVDISAGTYTIEGSILRRVGAVYVQILAGHYVDGKYDYVKKSNIFTLQIGRSLNGDVASVPTYEQSVEALEKVLLAEKSSSENVSKAESANNAAQAAQKAAEQAKEIAVKLASSTEKAAENAAQSEIAAQTAAEVATDKAAEISKSAEQIRKNTDNIAKLYSKSDGIVCSAEGSAITLNDSSDLGFSGMKIFGRSTQAITTGAQLLNISECNIPTQIGKITLKKADGSINLSGSPTVSSDGNVFTHFLGEYIDILEDGKTYSASGFCKLQVVENGVNRYWTKVTVNKSTMTNIKPYLQVSEKDYYDGMTIYPMLNEGDTVIAWEPYTGGQPSPNPDYPQEIVSVGNSGEIDVCANGKNLLPDTSATVRSVDVSVNNGVLKMTGTVDNTNTASRVYWRSNDLRNILTPGKSYYLWCDNPNIRLRFTASNVSDEVAIYTVTGDETNLSVWFILDDSPQEEGDKIDITARVSLSECEPQTVNISTPNGLPGIPVDNDGNYTDENGQQWVCDEVDLQRGVYVQRTEQTKLKSDDNWKLNTAGSRYYFNNVKATAASNSGIICTHFSRDTWVKNTINTISCGNKFQGVIGISVLNFDSVDVLKSFLDDNDVYIRYILAEPIETPLSADEITAHKSLHTNKPTTVISNSDNAHMSVDYTADTKTYIDNKFNELATAIIATGGDT